LGGRRERKEKNDKTGGINTAITNINVFYGWELGKRNRNLGCQFYNYQCKEGKRGKYLSGQSNRFYNGISNRREGRQC